MSTMPVPSPRAARRSLRRAWALALTLSLSLEPLAAQAAAGPARPASMEDARVQARALTVQGQASFDAGDYRAAADSWQQILEVLPEDSLNREERENALLIALEAFKFEYRQAVAVKGKPAAEDVTRLRQSLVLCREYAAELQRVYGAQGTVDGSVFESRAEIESMLAEAGTPDAAPEPVPVTGPQLERQVVDRGRSGTGLIVGGSLVTAAGLGMIPLIVIGARELKEANGEIQDARNIQPPDPAAEDRAEDHKRSANAMLISGSVLCGVLLAGGATMLGIGIRRRVRYMAFTPTFGPRYVGLGVGGRF